jgi:hypothetical protein
VVPHKKVRTALGEPDRSAFTAPLILSRGMRKSGSVGKNARTPVGVTSWLPSADLSPKGMRKSGSVEKTPCDSAGLALSVVRCASLTRGHEENWIR